MNLHLAGGNNPKIRHEWWEHVLRCRTEYSKINQIYIPYLFYQLSLILRTFCLVKK